MRYKAVSVETMQPGKKGGGKHWTKAEIAARKAAAEELERNEPVQLVPPDWLKEPEREVWAQILEQAKGLNLFDMLDQETLAVF